MYKKDSSKLRPALSTLSFLMRSSHTMLTHHIVIIARRQHDIALGSHILNAPFFTNVVSPPSSTRSHGHMRLSQPILWCPPVPFVQPTCRSCSVVSAQLVHMDYKWFATPA